MWNHVGFDVTVGKRGYAGYQKAEGRRKGGGGGERSNPTTINCPVAGDTHLGHDHEVQPPELPDSGQAALHSASEITGECCGLFGHRLPESGAAYHCYSLCAYICLIHRLKLMFFCIPSKYPDYKFLSLLRERDGHLVFLTREYFGLSCPGKQQKHSLLVITLTVLGEWL